jgi:hypothetical protein
MNSLIRFLFALGLISTPIVFCQTGDSNDPTGPHDPGIYLYSGSTMTVLEPAAYQGHKMKVIPYVPVSLKAIIQGPQASVRTNETTPTFYFYFEAKGANLGRGQFAGGATSPNQYALVKLEAKKADRETVIVKASIWPVGNSSAGTHNMVPFKLERLRPGVYKVIPTQALEHGAEYCFMSSYGGTGAAAAAEIYDFGVN